MVRRSAITLESECHIEERCLLLRIISENTFTDRHMEIGTAAGGTLKELIGAYAGRDYCPEFIVIDKLTYYAQQYSKICQNLKLAGIDPSSVAFWKGTTEDFLHRERLNGGSFDFILVDASHWHYPVTVDLQWGELLRQNGVICLHDYSERFPGVIWAVDRFLKRNKHFELFEHVRTMVALRKLSEDNSAVIGRSDLPLARIVQWQSRRARKLRKILRKAIG